MRYRDALVSSLSLLAACERSPGGGDPVCGVAMFAGPTTLLTQFEIPNQTLSAPPRNLPERLVARFVAGPAVPAIVGRTDSLLVIGLDATPPSGTRAGFGVLVVDQQERARGVMLYEGEPVEGAPRLGEVSLGASSVPLVGVQVDPAKIEEPRCPFFPDSVLQ
jgi:hypothetical protein